MAWFFKKKESKEADDPSLMRTETVTARSWWGLLFFAVVCLLIGLWVIFGYVPQTVEGKGIFISGRGLASIQARISGTVTDIKVQPGKEIKRGDPILTILNTQLELKLQSALANVKIAQSELQQLRQEIEKERSAEQGALQVKLEATQFNISQLEEDIDFLTNTLQKHKVLLDKGLISGATYLSEEQQLTQKKIDLEEKRSDLNALLSQIKKEYRPEELRNKEQQLLSDQEQRDVLQASIAQSKVISPFDGRVLEVNVNPGDEVKPGTQLIWLEKKLLPNEQENVVVYAYFPVDVGNRVHPGMQAEITVSAVNYNQYGAIIGMVQTVSPYAVSKENIYNRIKNQTIVNDLMGSNTAVVEALILPKKDPIHPGQFQWTSGKTPPVQVLTGTVGTVDVTVEKVRPLYYVLPLPMFKIAEKNQSATQNRTKGKE